MLKYLMQKLILLNKITEYFQNYIFAQSFIMNTFFCTCAQAPSSSINPRKHHEVAVFLTISLWLSCSAPLCVKCDGLSFIKGASGGDLCELNFTSSGSKRTTTTMTTAWPILHILLWFCSIFLYSSRNVNYCHRNCNFPQLFQTNVTFVGSHRWCNIFLFIV